MKLISKLGIILAATSIVACAPRDTVHYYSISDALNSSEAKTALNPKVQLYFGKAAPGKVVVPMQRIKPMKPLANGRLSPRLNNYKNGQKKKARRKSATL